MPAGSTSPAGFFIALISVAIFLEVLQRIRIEEMTAC
jgi:hypothetical protein